MFNDHKRFQRIQQVIPLIDNIYSDYARENNIPGYGYAIVVDGKLIHAGFDGYPDVKRKTPVTSQTVFRVASLSKSFTALAILHLRDAGKLHLDDPLSLYLQEMQDKKLTQDSPCDYS